tara:strand:- start:124 stop:360 length:237 start_codon:yes stop_codon:yes gene_type:complete
MSKVQTEDTRFVRDINSKALLATDLSALHKYREQKKQLQEKDKDYLQLKAKVNSLQNDITFIKQLLLEQLDVSERSTK